MCSFSKSAVKKKLRGTAKEAFFGPIVPYSKHAQVQVLNEILQFLFYSFFDTTKYRRIFMDDIFFF